MGLKLKVPWLTKENLMALLTSILALIMALAVGAILILVAGINPLVAYAALVDGAFGSVYSITETLVKAIPLLLAGLGIAVAFRCKVWNIGAEGQLYMGAVVSTWMGITFTGLPAVIHIPLITLGSFLAGGLWGAIPGILKAKLEVNEVITTLMMNYIALLGVSYLVTGPMRDPAAVGWPQTPPVAPSARLPVLIPPRFHAGILIALLSAALVYTLLWKTTLGYTIRGVGANPRAARYGGISVSRTMVIVMILSGGLAGLAGMVEVLGVHHHLLEALSPGYGYSAIVVALLGKLHPLGVTLAAVFFGALIVGADTMSYRAGVPIFLAYVIQGVVILFVLAVEHLKLFKRGVQD